MISLAVHPLELDRVKVGHFCPIHRDGLKSVSMVASAKSVLALPLRRFRWTDGPFESYARTVARIRAACENDANVAGFSTMNPTDTQL